MMATMHDMDEINSANDFDNDLDTPDPDYREDLGLRSFLSFEDDYGDDDDYEYEDDEDEGYIYDDER